MKKLFDWIVEQTPKYKNLHCRYSELMVINENLKENAIKDCRDIQELKKLLGEAESKIITLENFISCYSKKYKKIKKIRTYVNKLDKKDENVKEIKKLIKEVI